MAGTCNKRNNETLWSGENQGSVGRGLITTSHDFLNHCMEMSACALSLRHKRSALPKSCHIIRVTTYKNPFARRSAWIVSASTKFNRGAKSLSRSPLSLHSVRWSGWTSVCGRQVASLVNGLNYQFVNGRYGVDRRDFKKRLNCMGHKKGIITTLLFCYHKKQNVFYIIIKQ